jgi:hypothetical protein
LAQPNDERMIKMKYTISVSFVFEHVEAENEEQACQIVDSQLKYYIHHPQVSEIIQPDMECLKENDE